MRFTKQEHIDNLKRLNIENYSYLIGKKVYYVREVYGVHKVISYNEESEEYILDLDGQKFPSNPFRIKLINS